MKRWIWALAALALLWSPKSGVDVGKLRPVQVVCLAHEGAQVEIRTDVGAWGAGMDISAALEALHEGAEGVVVLDTAEYLLVDREDPALILEIGERLRPSCMVCIGDADPETVGERTNSPPDISGWTLPNGWPSEVRNVWNSPPRSSISWNCCCAIRAVSIVERTSSMWFGAMSTSEITARWMSMSAD